MSANSPDSAVSVSPHTPNSPPSGHPLHSANADGHLRSGSLSSGSSFFKWAAASLGKSPTFDSAMAGGAASGAGKPASMGGGTPAVPVPGAGEQVKDAKALSVPGDHEHHDEHHDSFETGELDGMAARGWGVRRAASMSSPAKPSGITAMLSGFGATSPPATGNGANTSTSSGSASLGVSPNSAGVLADKAAKGQGVLRRLSIGSGFARPSYIPPTNGPNQIASSAPASDSAHPPPAQGAGPTSAFPFVETEGGLQRGAKGRRYSESKKRGVSPMGERILRDQVHF